MTDQSSTRPSPGTTTQLQDPREASVPPPSPQAQTLPGEDQQLAPQADHGEETYVGGSGRLAGLVALITGSDSGIGRAIALAYAREGADVLISYYNEEEDADAEETCRLVTEAGRRAVAVRGDIGEEEHCNALVERTVAEFGRLDILINNAATQEVFDQIEDIPTETWKRIIRTNLDAMFYLCRAAVPHMQPGASIINTSSVQAFTPTPGLLPYAMTKGGIITFTKALAKMLGPRGIRVNAVCPGPIWTPLIPATMPAEEVSSFGQETPLGRPGQPAELAGVFVFLASPEASYVTGSAYGVHGGMDMP
jgi:NAD(P)-dependent dehydrogenase (short-subunit alcohol dehydrogenase family)